MRTNLVKCQPASNLAKSCFWLKLTVFTFETLWAVGWITQHRSMSKSHLALQSVVLLFQTSAFKLASNLNGTQKIVVAAFDFKSIILSKLHNCLPNLTQPNRYETFRVIPTNPIRRGTAHCPFNPGYWWTSLSTQEAKKCHQFLGKTLKFRCARM